MQPDTQRVARWCNTLSLSSPSHICTGTWLALASSAIARVCCARVALLTAAMHRRPATRHLWPALCGQAAGTSWRFSRWARKWRSFFWYEKHLSSGGSAGWCVLRQARQDVSHKRRPGCRKGPRRYPRCPWASSCEVGRRWHPMRRPTFPLVRWLVGSAEAVNSVFGPLACCGAMGGVRVCQCSGL